MRTSGSLRSQVARGKRSLSATLGFALLFGLLVAGSPATASGASPAPPNAWGLLAAGERTVVLASATGSNQTVLNNGTYFYNNPSASMGFAPVAQISQGSADVLNSSLSGTACSVENQGNLRLSWHRNADGTIRGGWRFGCATFLNSDNSAVRAVFHAEQLPSYYPSGPQVNVSHSTVTEGGWEQCYIGGYGTTVPFTTVETACSKRYILLAGGAGASVPVLATPALSGSVENGSGITFTFDQVSGAVSYTVRIFSAATGGIPVVTATNYLAGNTISGLTAGSSYFATIQAIGDNVNFQTSSESSPRLPFSFGAPPPSDPAPASSSAPAPPAAVDPVATPQNRRSTVAPPSTRPPVQSPVLQNNQLPTPPVNPSARVNGVPTQLQSLVTDPNNLSLRAGVFNIGINVQPNQGLVREGANGETEIQVRKGGIAGFQGTGLAPRTFVQVFMPMQGANAKEVARIPVDEAGSFNGEAVFQTGLQDAPLPIGRQVLQMVTVDERGRQNVVELAVNIVQPAPAPEINRENGQTPQLLPGQSLATNAGVPEVVNVTVIPNEKQTIIEGDGWTMGIAPDSDGSNVVETDDGNVLLELVRDETATVSGSGFMPGTRADVWLFSDPTLLGTVEIDENGAFNGTVSIDGQVIAVGEHTLQLQGVGEDGYVRAANLGVVVNDAESPASTEQAAGGLLWWLLALFAILTLAILLYARSRRRA